MGRAFAIILASPTTSFTSHQSPHGATITFKSPMSDRNEFCHAVHVPWSTDVDTIAAWNDVCADAIELFGLPGDRYQTEVNIDDMIWWFRDERDAMMFRLKFSREIA